MAATGSLLCRVHDKNVDVQLSIKVISVQQVNHA